MEYLMNNKPIILSNNNNKIIFNCFNNLKDNIDINYYYTLLNKLNDIDINNLINYINMKWYKMKKLINENFTENNKYAKVNIKQINSNNDLNIILKDFIKSDKILGIFVINCIHKLFY